MALFGRFPTADVALQSISQHGVYRVERDGSEYVVYIDDPLGPPLGNDELERERV